MRSTRLMRILRERYRRTDGPAGDHAALESRLLASHRVLYPTRKRWIMNRRAFVLMSSLAIVLLGLAACTIPTSYETEMGQSLSIVMETDGPMPDMRGVVEYLAQQAGVEEANVNVRKDGASARLDLALWGKGLDGKAMIDRLRADFEFLAQAEIIVEPLSVRVDAPLYERMGHELFGMEFEIEVDGQTEEEIRQQILDQLAASGFEGEAQVDVQMEQQDGMERVEIRIETEQPDQPE